MTHLEILGALPEHEVAALFAVEPKTLANWRAQNAGPAYTRAGGVVLYPIKALRTWIEDNVIVPAPAAASITEVVRRGPGRPRKQAAPAEAA